MGGLGSVTPVSNLRSGQVASVNSLRGSAYACTWHAWHVGHCAGDRQPCACAAQRDLGCWHSAFKSHLMQMSNIRLRVCRRHGIRERHGLSQSRSACGHVKTCACASVHRVYNWYTTPCFAPSHLFATISSDYAQLALRRYDNLTSQPSEERNANGSSVLALLSPSRSASACCEKASLKRSGAPVSPMGKSARLNVRGGSSSVV